jgi:hypothetical protein
MFSKIYRKKNTIILENCFPIKPSKINVVSTELNYATIFGNFGYSILLVNYILSNHTSADKK